MNEWDAPVVGRYQSSTDDLQISRCWDTALYDWKAAIQWSRSGCWQNTVLSIGERMVLLLKSALYFSSPRTILHHIKNYKQ